MDLSLSEKDIIVSRIISGVSKYRIGNKVYVVTAPTLDIIAEANELYHKILREHSFEEDWLSASDARLLSMRLGFIKPDIEKTIKDLETSQEDVKVNIFQNFLQENSLKPLRKQLGLIRKKLNELVYNQHMFDYVTPEGFASLLKNQFILIHTTFDENHKRIWNDWDVPFQEVDMLMGEVNHRALGHDLLRYLSHNEPWHNYYYLAKDNPFNNHPSMWTEDQKVIMSYSRMYDNINEHPEAPSDAVINDNDALDGWMIKQRRQREKDKLGNEVDKMLGNQKNSQEVYIPVDNAEAAQKINELNSPEAKMAKAKRSAALNAKGEIQEQDLPDIRQELQMQATQALMNRNR